MRAYQFVIAVMAAALLAAAVSERPARADDRSANAVLYIGVPILDGAIGVGGLVTMINTGVNLSDAGAKPSRGWRTMSWVFGGLNTALAIGWSATSMQLGWYAAMPALTHGIIGVVNLALGWRSLRREQSGPRVSLVPLVTADKSQLVAGIGLSVMNF